MRAGWCAAAMAVGCTGGEPDPDPVADTMQVVVPFEARVAGAPFACGTSFPGIGQPPVSIEALDFRLYVHDVALIDADGNSVEVALEQDERWQHENVALLDFEDGSAACATGSPELRTEIVGEVPAGDYVGLTLRIGVPAAMNHLDAAVAPPPLNDPGLWWAWTSGFKYARIDMKTPENPSFYFHLGATTCVREDGGEYTCALDNLPLVELGDFVPDGSLVVIDLGDFYADSDLEAVPDFVTDFVSGCMAFEGDPECDALLPKIGLPWRDAEAQEQLLLRVEAL